MSNFWYERVERERERKDYCKNCQLMMSMLLNCDNGNDHEYEQFDSII